MGTSPVDLWPKDFGPVERTPVAIMKEQASLLGKHTGNLVLGEIRLRPQSLGDEMKAPGNNSVVEFRLIAPALDNYAYVLFSLGHRLEAQYPLRVLLAPGAKGMALGKEPLRDEDELITFMQQVFSTIEAKSVIKNLIAQSNLEAPV